MTGIEIVLDESVGQQKFLLCLDRGDAVLGKIEPEIGVEILAIGGVAAMLATPQ